MRYLPLHLVIVAVPLAAGAIGLDPVDRTFTLSGGIGLRAEDYQYDSGDSGFGRERFQKELNLNTTGYVWDPRFISFGAGVTLLADDVQTSAGDMDMDSVGYHLNTNWFANRPHPLTILADKRRDIVADLNAPSYDLTTETLGVHWGLDSALLGNIRMSYDRLDAESDGPIVSRDETSEVLSFEGGRRILRDSGTESDVTYGYRFNESEDAALGALQRQHYWYAYDRTAIGDDVNINTNLTYYDREDAWRELDELGGGQQQLDSRFFGFNSGLNIRSGKALQHFYNLSVSRNHVNLNQTDSHNVRAGFSYQSTPRLEWHGAAGLNGNTMEGQDGGTLLFGDVAAGFRVSQSLGTNLLHGGYSVGFEHPIENREGESYDDVVTHTGSFGISRRGNAAFQDAIDYRVHSRLGYLHSYENNLRYSVSGRMGDWNILQGTAEYRRFTEEGLDVDRLTENRRVTGSWTRRLAGNGTFTLSAGSSSTMGEPATIRRDHIQGRFSITPMRRGNLRIRGLARREEEGSTGNADVLKTTIETDIVYRFGQWENTLQYRQRRFDGSDVPVRERSIMFYVQRGFALQL